jgi:hypothetical protein
VRIEALLDYLRLGGEFLAVRCQWERQREVRAFAGCALDSGGAAIFLDEGTDNGKAESHAAGLVIPSLVDLIKAFENVWNGFGRDPTAGVFDRELYPVFDTSAFDRYTAAWGSVFERIVQ